MKSMYVMQVMKYVKSHMPSKSFYTIHTGHVSHEKLIVQGDPKLMIPKYVLISQERKPVQVYINITQLKLV